MVNRVILVGNLTRDAESIATAGRSMTRMRLATNSRWKDAAGNRQELAEFHTVIAFGPQAESCFQYCHRGNRVYVEGRLRTREYTTAEGQQRTTTEIVADTVQFLSPRSAQQETGGAHEVDGTGVEAAMVG